VDPSPCGIPSQYHVSVKGWAETMARRVKNARPTNYRGPILRTLGAVACLFALGNSPTENLEGKKAKKCCQMRHGG